VPEKVLHSAPTFAYGARMGERPALFLGLLADQPELIAEVGVLRWRAAGQDGTPGPWIESTARDAGRDGLPLTLVAMGLDGQVIGAVTLGAADDDDVARSSAIAPWLVRMVVRPGERRCGIGRLMIAAAEDLAREHGHATLWVAPRQEDLDFYRACGWLGSDDAGHEAALVLRKQLQTV
jgi:GNAT superfamily N-acetyltransferase